MICLGKSNYFRFNHPTEAKRIKESHPGNRFSIVPDQYYPGMIDGFVIVVVNGRPREKFNDL